MDLIKTLNIGCGKDDWGTHRIDLYKTPITTHVVNVDKEKLPFPDNFFDEVRILGAFEHFKNMGFVLDEVYRVMKKGARLWIRTDHAGFLPFYIFRKMEHSYISKRWYSVDYFGHSQGEDHHYHLFVESHLRALLKDFNEVEVSYFYMNPSRLKNFILRMLPKKLGASQIDVIAWK
jgi:ubiquinone/menaquinone biosynthesis C-methylase UbiE